MHLDILTNVLIHLSPAQVKPLLTVNREWHRAAQARIMADVRLCTPAAANAFVKYAPAERVRGITLSRAAVPLLHSLNMPNIAVIVLSPDAPPEALLTPLVGLVPKLSRLRSLYISLSSSSPTVSLDPLMRSLTYSSPCRLSTLHISSLIALSDDAFVSYITSPAATFLSDLLIANSPYLTLSSLEAIAFSTSQLRHLSLHRLTGLRQSALNTTTASSSTYHPLSLIAYNQRSLVSLSLAHLPLKNLPENVFQPLKYNDLLHTVTLSHLDWVFPVHLAYFSSCRSLSLRMCHNVDHLPSNSLPKLISLRLLGSQGVTVGNIVELGKHALRNLTLDACAPTKTFYPITPAFPSNQVSSVSVFLHTILFILLISLFFFPIRYVVLSSVPISIVYAIYHVFYNHSSSYSPLNPSISDNSSSVAPSKVSSPSDDIDDYLDYDALSTDLPQTILLDALGQASKLETLAIFRRQSETNLRPLISRNKQPHVLHQQNQQNPHRYYSIHDEERPPKRSSHTSSHNSVSNDINEYGIGPNVNFREADIKRIYNEHPNLIKFWH